MIIDRTIGDAVLSSAAAYPVVAVTGPRQSGKTTLVRRLFADLPYVLLEDPDQRRFATEDPRRFLSRFPDGVVLDEVQRAPELISYLQGCVDVDPRPGRFILTGSQQFGLLSGITQSLAGRVAMMTLLPFSSAELADGGFLAEHLDDLLLRGFYPPVHDRRIDPSDWYRNYVQTYIERDMRQLINVRDLSTFETFLRMCAARCSQLLNLSALASDCGITHNTARAWISVLQASYIVHTLPPYFRNFSKRLIKSPKLYFLDSGLAAWLLGIRSTSELAVHPMRGSLFETWVYSEMLKAAHDRGERPSIFFWRDRAGLEIDFLIDKGGRLRPTEAKSGETFVLEWLHPLERWKHLAGDSAGDAILIYGGADSGKRGEVECIGWRDLPSRVDVLLGS